jgi:hypothetical protein
MNKPNHKEQKMKTRRIGFRMSAIALAIAASTIFVSGQLGRSHAQQITENNSSRAESLSGRTLEHPRLKLADGHADICKENEQQCLKGCDGATSCSNQCVVNYNGCMAQGG